MQGGLLLSFVAKNKPQEQAFVFAFRFNNSKVKVLMTALSLLPNGYTTNGMTRKPDSSLPPLVPSFIIP
ncbi:hypothetical protein FHW36_101622 [Chitinophaga polysaccharea]|uniref:Uncharacterized protein n=1 Tax=Chitinophaga polysaccharea TaxID=1293035 RepID=A0A561Q2V8_9BACT|nr:hypothetical protein FHW36_101622 [Chitinophaga polysaccharea]